MFGSSKSQVKIFQKVFKIYHKMPKILHNFPEELKENTEKKLIQKKRTSIYQQICHTLFRLDDIKSILGVLVAWQEENVLKKQNKLYELVESLESENHHNLAKLLAFTSFKNQVKNLDHQSVVFNQCQEDIKIFAEHLIKNKINDEDTEILMDFLLSILSVENKELRKMVEECLKSNVSFLKQDTINHIVSEILTPLDLTDNLLIDETIESESDADLDDEEQDIHI